MNNRLQKIEELMESFQSFKRPVAFGHGHSKMSKITPSQWMALRIIGKFGTCTVKDISKSLHLTSSAVTQLVDGLVKSRYVARKINTKDRRKVTLMLSQKGIRDIEGMKKQMLDQMLSVFKVLNDKEFEQLYKLNKKITDSFNK